ncbi:MAG: DUF3322 domain-containing protein [Cyanobacteria bacterium J06634_5]
MITPEDIRKKALRQYERFLKAGMSEERFFPIQFPVGKIPKAYPDLLKSVTQLLNGSKAEIGQGYRVTLDARNTRKYGQQSIPTQIYIDTEQDYLALLKKEQEFSRFCADSALIQSRVPQLASWVSEHPLKVVEKAGYWPDLLKVCDYFQKNPNPNLYIRELPIAVHTKFIEEHKESIRSLLEEILPAEQLMPVDGKRHTFEQRFSLKYSEPLLRLRFLDPALQQKVGFPVADVSLTVSEVDSLPLKSHRCFVTENLMPFLTLPPLANSIAIFGSGYANQLLGKARWLNSCSIFYWGDMDVDGFKILAQLRSHFPQTQSLMMNTQTYKRFEPFAVTVPAQRAHPLSHLSEQEATFCAWLAAEGKRLEQERIDQAYVNECLQGLSF